MKWFARLLRDEDVAEAVESILDTKLRQTVTALRSVDDLVVEKARLAEEVAELTRQGEKLSEDVAREEWGY